MNSKGRCSYIQLSLNSVPEEDVFTEKQIVETARTFTVRHATKFPRKPKKYSAVIFHNEQEELEETESSPVQGDNIVKWKCLEPDDM